MANKNLQITHEILDEGIIKKLSKKEYNHMKHNYHSLCRMKCREHFERQIWDEDTGEMIVVDERNENYKEVPKRIEYAMKQVEDEMTWAGDGRWNKDWNGRMCYHAGGEQAILDYLDIIPFVPWVMINISPDWKDTELTRAQQKGKLQNLLKNYFEEQWYDRVEYVIEDGQEGNHIHLHCMCRFNTSRLKSVKSHIAKGNWKQQLLKHAKGVKGMERAISKIGMKSTTCNCEELVQDKLDYLEEEKKPVGHTNKGKSIRGNFVL